jgi:hypothetical protein
MNTDSERIELKELILENQRLLAENNELLKKMHRSVVRHFGSISLGLLFSSGCHLLRSITLFSLFLALLEVKRVL